MNRFWHARVIETSKRELESVAHYLDPWYEIETKLVARPTDYTVLKAVATVVRAPGGREAAFTRELKGLAGAVPYAGIGKRIRAATEGDATGLLEGLLLENTKALRQARVFVWERVGMNPLDYLPLIEALLKDSCINFARPNSVLESVLRPKQLDEMVRWDCLFTRQRYCHMQWDGEAERITAGLSDSYHEMRIEALIHGDQVTEVEGRILRAPHKPCFDAEPTHEQLLGARVSEGPRNWEKRVQGPRGCTHLADVAREVCNSLEYWRATRSDGERARAIAGG
ncbi:MAG: DUF2889 domain-containing protein [Deltaproteobacteria bacterium]|nr:DUF2889 domain-containing protein [Deltaproteobacteria bacterium]